MKAMILVTFAVLVLDAGAAFAQGTGVTASSGTYGQAWAATQRAKSQHDR
jgi:hypothetical protein